MENSVFAKIVEEELKKQKMIMVESQRTLKNAPRGTLRCRERKFKKTFYARIYDNGTSHEINITQNPRMQKRLIKKELSRLMGKYAEKNIRALERLRIDYVDNSITAVLKKVSRSYTEAIKECGYEDARQWAANQSKQYNYDPKKHIHETISGVKVRSKSEALIANVLTESGIPFYYEKPFQLPGEENHFFYPDFTIELPDGQVILWEHFGLLHEFGYCMHNAEKFHSYQLSGFVIGDNLIITQDDIHGGCSSRLIYQIVKTYLLPYFK